MGKRRKRMMMKKYAKKYALQRKTLGFDKEKEMIEIDMTTGEEIKEDDTVQVVTNKTSEKPEEKQSPPWDVEPQLQTVEVEEPKVDTPPPVEAKKVTRKRATRKKTTSTRRATPKKIED